MPVAGLLVVGMVEWDRDSDVRFSCQRSVRLVSPNRIASLKGAKLTLSSTIFAAVGLAGLPPSFLGGMVETPVWARKSWEE